MSQQPYWTLSQGPATRPQTCRECKRLIPTNAPLVARDGRKIRLFYHPECFSGDADPRTQPRSSASDLRYKGVVGSKAPEKKGAGKWSVESYGYNPSPR
ncbi:hypothetical protein BC832DRAFT_563414 [Gaertneriomyces semiglobifer]|nr:hypothetical protein BC832DRAFT_563414 [Gaertneriomyces semiglobifer]